MKKYLTFIKQHWMMVVIIVIATLLRTWDIDHKAIFFGDAAHDLLVAAQSVEQRNIPLLGIASSVPRFKQGPLTVWLEMIIYLIAGYHLLVYSLVFAAISVAAVIGVYEYAAIYTDKRQGILAALLVATSPLGVAHGRVVYHITPIPIMMVVFWFALMKLWKAEEKSTFWAVLAWCGLFQFELALLPAVFMIPYIWWRTKQRLTKSLILQSVLGLALGLLPQLMYDLTHRFSQLGGFAVWVGYRLVSATGLIGQQSFSPDRLGTALQAFWLYSGRVVSTDNSIIKSLFLTIVMAGLIKAGLEWGQRRLKPATEIVVVTTLMLAGGFIIHSSPSEAYFPPFIVCIPFIVAYAWSQLIPKWRSVGALSLSLVALITATQIVQHNFFVSTDKTFNYGPGVGELRQIQRFVSDVSNQRFMFATTQEGGKFPSFFDNLRWVAAEHTMTEDAEGDIFYVEAKDSLLNTYPGMKKASFPSVDLYQVPRL